MNEEEKSTASAILSRIRDGQSPPSDYGNFFNGVYARLKIETPDQHPAAFAQGSAISGTLGRQFKP